MLRARVRVMPDSFGRKMTTMMMAAAVMRRPDTPGAPTVESMSVTSTAAVWVPIEPMRTRRTGATGRVRNLLTPCDNGFCLVAFVWVFSRDTRATLVQLPLVEAIES